MKSLTLILLVLALFTQSQTCSNKSTSNDSEQYVVMLSMDAFRWDYPDKFETPNLDNIATQGVKAKSLVPCFPGAVYRPRRPHSTLLG